MSKGIGFLILIGILAGALLLGSPIQSPNLTTLLIIVGFVAIVALALLFGTGGRNISIGGHVTDNSTRTETHSTVTNITIAGSQDPPDYLQNFWGGKE